MPIKLANNTLLSCYLSNWAKNLVYLPKDSASPSEVIFADILEGKTVHSIAIKLFVDVTSTKDIKNYAAYYNEINNIEGIKYEVKVYRDIINKIIDKKQSPNFIRFIGYGDCPMDTIEYIDMPMMKVSIAKLYGPYYISDNRDANLGILVTEKPKNVMSFSAFARHADKSDMLQVIFQVVYSLAVMQKYRLVHNDLHSGNILIQKIDRKVRYYKVGKTVYKITTPYQPLIFDWDLSYSDELGKNKKISMEEDAYCGQTNICNRFSEKFDLYVFICLLNMSGYNIPLEIKDIFIKDDLNLKKEHNMSVSLPNRIIPSIEEKGPPEEIFKKHFQPYIYDDKNGVYKMGRKQLEYAFGKEWLTANFPKVTSLTFIIKNGKLKLYSPFICRPNSFSSNFPTPLQLIKDPMFFELHTKQEQKLDGPIYTMPEFVSVKVKIRKSTYIPSTRHKISRIPSLQNEYDHLHKLEKRYKINATILNMYLSDHTKKVIHNTIYRDLNIFYKDGIMIYSKLFLTIRLLYLFITKFIYKKQYQLDKTILAFLTIICVHMTTNQKSTRSYMENRLEKAGIRDYILVSKYKKMVTNFIKETDLNQAPSEYNFLELYFRAISPDKINSKKIYECCKYLGRKMRYKNYFYFSPSMLAAAAMLYENSFSNHILRLTNLSLPSIIKVNDSLK